METNDVAAITAETIAAKTNALWAQMSLHDVLPRILLAFLVYLILLLILRLGSSRSIVRRLSLPLNLLGLTFAIRLFLGRDLALIHAEVPRVFTAAAVFLFIFLAMRFAEIAIFDFLFLRQGRKPVPIVLRDIARFVLTATFFAFIVKVFFPGLNLNVLAVSSIVVGYVLGNATQDTLGNLIAGLALNSEDCFSIGDWISLGDLTGQVTDITWRSTRLRTKNKEDIIVPNATLSREIVVNYSRPTPELRVRVSIGVSYETPPNRVRQTLLDAIRDTPNIDPQPAPQIRLVEYGDFAIVYEALFYIHDFVKLEAIKADFMNLVWYRFKRADISIPFPIRDVRTRTITREDELAGEQSRMRDIGRLLAGMDLFDCLSEPERLTLAAGCQTRVFAAREEIVRQGDPGLSLFLVETGRVGVFVTKPDGSRVSVNELGPGQFFGERSLLTGENRSATVTALQDTTVVELAKEAFESVIQAKPEIAEFLGRALAERDLARQALTDAAKPPDPEAARVKGRQFMDRILHFFGRPIMRPHQVNR